MITIYSSSGSSINIEADDKSYIYAEICAEDYIQLHFSLTSYITIGVGYYIIHEGRTYRCWTAPDVKLNNARNYEYTARFWGAATSLKKSIFRNPIDGRIKFSLTAKPQEHLAMIVQVLNNDGGNWSVGDYVDGAEKEVTYNAVTCYDALQLIAQAFETEWEITGNTIHLHKVEHNSDSPISVSYGKGHGLLSGVQRSAAVNDTKIDRLYIQGGERNIDASKYGSTTLRLPKRTYIAYDGKHFSWEDGYESSGSKSYFTDDKGQYLELERGPFIGIAPPTIEGCLDCSEIYPQRVGRVTTSIAVDTEKNIYNIADNSIPSTLDYNDYLIAGAGDMTLVFQSGMLAGKEFAVRYVHNSVNGAVPRRFEIVPRAYDGIMMPGSNYAPAVGDTYAIFNVSLPDAYIEDEATHSGAAWEMAKKAVRYLYDNQNPKHTFSAKLDGMWCEDNWDNIGSRLILGGSVSISFGDSTELLRISSIKTALNALKRPAVTIDNIPATRTLSLFVDTIKGQEVSIVEANQRTYKNLVELNAQSVNKSINMYAEELQELSSEFKAFKAQYPAGSVRFKELADYFMAWSTYEPLLTDIVNSGVKRPRPSDGFIAARDDFYAKRAALYAYLGITTDTTHKWATDVQDGAISVPVADQALNIDGGAIPVDALFTQRPTAGSQSVLDSNAYINKFKGLTLIWNQWIANGDFVAMPSSWSSNQFDVWYATKASFNVSSNITSSGRLPINVSNGGGIYTYLSGFPMGYGIVSLVIETDAEFTCDVELMRGSTVVSKSTLQKWGENTYYSLFGTQLNGDITQMRLLFNLTGASSADVYVSNIMLHSLSQMFGFDDDYWPISVDYSQFKALFPKPYYITDYGSLKYVSPKQFTTTGFNQLIEINFRAGWLRPVNGAPVVDSSNTEEVCNTQQMPMFPDTKYYCNSPSSVGIFFYDHRHRYIGFVYVQNEEFTSPSRTAYFTVGTKDYGSNAYRYDICINLSHTGKRNGEYERYTSATMSFTDTPELSTTGIQGIGDVADEITTDKIIRRFRRIPSIRAFAWSYDSSTSVYSMQLPQYYKPNTWCNVRIAPFTSYPIATAATIGDGINKALYVSQNGNTVYIRDTEFDSDTDPLASFLAKYQDSSVVLELLTEDSFDNATPFPSLAFTAHDFGTESVITWDNLSPDTIFRGEITYGFNAVDRVRDNDYKSEINYARIGTLSRNYNDIAFLKNVFQNTLIQYGCVLSRLLAVLDSNDDVKAGLYGGGVTALDNLGYKDDVMGTLMMFAGAAEVDNAAQANFRVYEDGTLFANRGVFGGLLQKAMTTITPDSITLYTHETISTTTVGATIDLVKTGSFIKFQGFTSGKWGVASSAMTKLRLPYYSSGLQYPAEWSKEQFLSLVGADIVLLFVGCNPSNLCLEVNGSCVVPPGNTVIDGVFRARCVFKAQESSYGTVEWEFESDTFN